MQLLRIYHINRVMLEHGLDELIPAKWLPWYVRLMRMSIFWIRNQHKEKNAGARLTLALQALGPVFIKFGQMLSTRRDLLPPEIANELAMLQDRVKPFDSERATAIILKALNIASLDQVFSEFSETPLASASIAQVHAAKLKDCNTDVVVKVLRPDIRKTIKADTELMLTFAKVLQKWLPDGKRLRPVEVVKEYEKTIVDELDLNREAANGMQLGRNFEGSEALYVPSIYSDYCTKNVLVMERIYGIPISNIEALIEQDTNLRILAERGVEVFFTQVFRDSFFHADMHPGNIFVSRENPQNPQYIAIDFGIVGTLNQEDKRYLAENFIAFFNRDYRKVAQLHADSGWVPSDTNIDEFEVAIRTVCEPIFQKPLAEISFGNVLVQLFNTARRFNMVVQPQLVLLQKTLLYIEGLGRQLYPQLDLWQTAKPFLENWMREQIGVRAMFSKVKSNLPYWSEKLPDMPDLLYDTLKQVKHFPEKQQQANAALLQQQKRAQKALHFSIVGATLIIVAAILPLYPAHWSLSAGLALLGSGCWFVAWWKGRR
ncbi:MAG: ubiquinone biosynthesis regulatory protein kinase UbiB [Pseudomonadota bacterium]|jgi:ubiquinone biosynthesis protein|nr:ubiquinone biosynthesis regulatory protein kinase UbiB [Alteromonadaceae bacterium]MDY6926304.1 ubiquinone biosynthesis regulatory protein kinase UbiB [Pseudomonadota bacterium]RPH19490.1 MAG: ubiquinone biosynthesis regulatory protein kinase UbiB [Alteromonadaceae bacterium TMED7]HCA76267.1 ubiquinone biosynthesis regulatory protein kinase UbiB [Alteromonas sp.]HCL12326.1 ubiquinone biosynthesis regulatory protein kinase UbiB [Alteromonas sp.]|tara:strand:- start:403 stop:2034 length:1632 start_codon:yes stop_codon:yes gene_type:complete